MKVPPFIRRHLRLFILIALILLSTILVSLSVASILFLPIVWWLTKRLYLTTQNPKIKFFYQTFSVSISVYFIVLLALLISTPVWIKKMSLFLERHSLFTWFDIGSFMYGRLFICFLLFTVIFLSGLWIFRKRF